MEVEEEKAHVRRAIGSRPTDFESSDVRPLRRRRAGPPSLIPIPQRTVFQPGTDWRDKSTNAVLDALHSTCARQANEADASRAALRFSRCAGSVVVHDSMADLFDAQVTVPTQLETEEAAIVQCRTCGRPVLLTRFLAHHKECVTRVSGAKVTDTDSGEHDTQKDLIYAPYGRIEESDADESGHAFNCNDLFSVDVPSVSAARKRGRGREGMDWETRPAEHCDMFSFPREEDGWEMTLTSLAPRYVPRGASARKRRVALPSQVGSSAQKKRSANTEKRSLQAAAAAGIVRAPQQQGLSTAVQNNEREDPLKLLARELGERAPWSKLMQVAMPVALPRNPNTKKISQPQEVPSSQLYLLSTGKPPASSGRGSKGKNMDVTDKQVSNIISPKPSLVGSLLWIRGKGLREMSNTVLYNMDAAQHPVGRTGAIFHGQTYVAELGTFETDPRAQTTIKMPLAAPAPPRLSGKATNVTGYGKAQGPSENRLKKAQGAPASKTASAGLTMTQPPSKKQRTAKVQRGHSSGLSGQATSGGMQAKSGQPMSRKTGGSARAPVLTGVNARSAAMSFESQQRQVQPRSSVPMALNGVTSAAIATASAAAAKYTSQQIAQQKKGFRAATGTMAVPARPGQPVQVGMSAGGGIPVPSKGSSRGGKGRSYPSQAGNNPSTGMRSAGGKVIKAASPSQGSSRSGERVPLQHRASPMSAGQFDTVLMGSAVNAATSAMNRAAVIRGTPGKPQMDFQQAMAQVAGQAVLGPGRDNSSAAASRGMLHQGTSKGPVLGTEKFPGHIQRGNIHAIATQSRAKQGVPIPIAQQRLANAHKNSRGQLRGQARKDDRDVQQKGAELEAQLRRTDPTAGDVVGAKGGKRTPQIVFGNRADRNNVPMNHLGVHPSKGLYSAALAAASAQPYNASINSQANLALFRMAQASQNSVSPGTGVAPNMLQNVHDMRPLQNLVVPGMQPGTHNQNVLSFLQTPAFSNAIPMSGATPISNGMSMSTGIAQTGSMNNPAATGIPAAAIAGPGNQMLSTGDAILQQLLSAGRGSGLMPNAAGLHAQPMGPAGTQLGQSHAHQVGRAAGVTPMARPVVPTTQNAAIDEIDRALGLSFDESDLQD